MKKILLVLLTLMLSLGMLAGCGDEPEGQHASEGEDAATFLTVTMPDGEAYSMDKAAFEALEMVEHEISKTNSMDETTTATYKGVAWPVLAADLGIDTESTVIAVASDGYEVELTPEMLNDPQSMFALYEDGEPIESQDGGEIWFCAGENYTANNWAKYVVELKVQ